MEKNRKFLLYKRKSGLFMGDFWEFPTTIVEQGDTIEDALERWVFESLGVSCICTDFLPVFETANCRIFPVRIRYKSEKRTQNFESSGKLLSYNEIRELKLTFPSVIFIKRNKKKFFFDH